MSNPLVSIITPCYNGGHCVHRLFDSILAQNHRPLEFILINDGSTDNTMDIVEQYRPIFQTADIKFICHTQENHGLGGAINAGLKLITGEYFCWPDADDYLEPTSVADRVEVLQKNPKCAVVTSDAYIRDFDNLGSYRALIGRNQACHHETKQFDLFLNGHSIFCCGCHMVRVKAFDTVNPKREIYPVKRGQNWQLLLPLYYKYERIYLDKPLYNYLRYPTQMSKDYGKEDRLFRYREHYEILTNTLKMIEDVQKVNLAKYYKFLEDKYAKLNLQVALEYSDWNLFRIEYAKKQETVGIDKTDLVFYLIYRLRMRLFRRIAIRLLNQVESVCYKKLIATNLPQSDALPLVSIIVPIYNGEHFISKCFHSVLQQTYRNIELIVVNDGSTDQSEQEIQSFEPMLHQRGIHFRYIRQDNQGAAAAVNHALKLVTGEFLMLYDVDDILFGDAVGDKVSYLQKNPQAGMVCSNGYYIRNLTEIANALFYYSGKEQGKDVFTRLLDGAFYNWPGSFMVRTKALWEQLHERTIYTSQYGQNLQIMLPVAWKNPCGMLSTPQMKYYVHSGSHSHRGGWERTVERSRGYENNRIGIIRSLKMDVADADAFVRRIQCRAAMSRIRLGVLARDWAFVNKEMEDLKQKKSFTVLTGIQVLIWKWTSRIPGWSLTRRVFSKGYRIAAGLKLEIRLIRVRSKNYEIFEAGK